MKITLTNSYFIGMIISPILLSCTTPDHETNASPNDVPKSVVAKPLPKKTTYGKLRNISFLSDSFFDFDSSTLKDFDSAALKPVSAQLLETFIKEQLDLQNELLINVYTDRTGSKNYNEKLSLHRAEVIKIYLISKGISPNRISTSGRGENDSVTGDECHKNMKREVLIDCLSPDRRIEIKVQ